MAVRVLCGVPAAGAGLALGLGLRTTPGWRGGMWWGVEGEGGLREAAGVKRIREASCTSRALMAWLRGLSDPARIAAPTTSLTIELPPLPHSTRRCTTTRTPQSTHTHDHPRHRKHTQVSFLQPRSQWSSGASPPPLQERGGVRLCQCVYLVSVVVCVCLGVMGRTSGHEARASIGRGVVGVMEGPGLLRLVAARPDHRGALDQVRQCLAHTSEDGEPQRSAG